MSSTDRFVARNDRERRGARDGRDRLARVARFLAAKPRSASVTELVLALEDGDIITRWDTDAVDEALAYQIDALMDDAARDLGTTVGMRLIWMAGDASYQSKGFRVQCPAEDAEHVRPLDGSQISLIQAAQRHAEAFASQIATITQRSEERVERFLAIQERILDKLLMRLDDSERKREAAEEREIEALELAETAAAQGEAAAADAAAATAGKDDPLGKVIEIASKQLIAGGTS